MGNVKIRYYVTRKAWPGSRARWGYWVPTKKMRSLGFAMVCCGEDGPAAWAIAARMNEQWDKVRRGDAVACPSERSYPPGSLGEAYGRYRATKTWMEKKPRTREDWERGWNHIDPIFGDLDPRTVALEDLDGWYAALLETAGVREAHRAMKIWRALWRVAGTINAPHGARYCNRTEDPSLGIRRKTPTPRNQIWFEGEAVRLVKRAVRMGYHGLAAALAVSWDTMLSPIDVRTLTKGQLSEDGHGQMFSVDRAKTGKAAIGTLSRRTGRLLATYIASLPFTLMPGTPIFHTRGFEPSAKGGKPRPPVPYRKDSMGDDFRAVRAAEFPGDKRQVMDFRRSGAVEAEAGEVDPGALAKKMANTIDTNRDLQSTYLPQNATLVRLADHARGRGRSRMRGNAGSTKGPKS